MEARRISPPRILLHRLFEALANYFFVVLAGLHLLMHSMRFRFSITQFFSITQWLHFNVAPMSFDNLSSEQSGGVGRPLWVRSGVNSLALAIPNVGA